MPPKPNSLFDVPINIYYHKKGLENIKDVVSRKLVIKYSVETNDNINIKSIKDIYNKKSETENEDMHNRQLCNFLHNTYARTNNVNIESFSINVFILSDLNTLHDKNGLIAKVLTRNKITPSSVILFKELCETDNSCHLTIGDLIKKYRNDLKNKKIYLTKEKNNAKVNINQFYGENITIHCDVILNKPIISEKKTSKEEEDTANFNAGGSLYYKLKSELSIKNEGNKETLIELDYKDFFIIQYILLRADLAHDIRDGLRKSEICRQIIKNTQYVKHLSNKTEFFLKILHDELIKEFNDFCTKVNIYGKKKEKTIATMTNMSGLGSNLESEIYNKITNLINDESEDNDPLSSYNETREALKDIHKANEAEKFLLEKEPKFVSNNAFAYKHIDSLPFFSDECIYNNTKSLPASLFDGAHGTDEGGDIYKAFNNKRIEYGSYDIKFTIKNIFGGLTLPTEVIPFLHFKSYFVTGNANEGIYSVEAIYQMIEVNRRYIENKDVKVEKETYKFKLLDLNGNWEKVILNNDLISFFNKDETPKENLIYKEIKNPPVEEKEKETKTIETIKTGDIGLYIKNPEKRTTRISTLHKSLCDFLQYLNSLIDDGGYDGKQIFCNINDKYNPLSKLSKAAVLGPAPSSAAAASASAASALQSVESEPRRGPEKSYPCLTLHTDMPAGAENMFALYCIPPDKVNKMSHTLYGSDATREKLNEYKLGNWQGIVAYGFNTRDTDIISVMNLHTITNRPPMKKRRFGGGQKGGVINNELIKKRMIVLFDFFRLCVEFKMPGDFIPLYNNIYNIFLERKGDEDEDEDEDFKQAIDYIKNVVNFVKKGEEDINNIKKKLPSYDDNKYINPIDLDATLIDGFQSPQKTGDPNTPGTTRLIHPGTTSPSNSPSQFSTPFTPDQKRSDDTTPKKATILFPEGGRTIQHSFTNKRKRAIQKNNKTIRKKSTSNKKHNITQTYKLKTRKYKQIRSTPS